MNFNITRVRNIRTASGLTQIQVAELMGINQANYHRRETGLVDLTIPELETLAKIFRVDMAAFFERTQPMTAGEKGQDVEYWQKRYYKLLGKFEMLDEIYREKPSLPKRVSQLPKEKRASS